jgi:hypothetical protein
MAIHALSAVISSISVTITLRLSVSVDVSALYSVDSFLPTAAIAMVTTLSSNEDVRVMTTDPTRRQSLIISTYTYS